MNRWKRRTNLHKAPFRNCFAFNRLHQFVIKDKNGNIIGSTGFHQDYLYHITDNLNLTIEILEHPWKQELLENNSWTGGIGFLQRQEADVVSTGMGITLQRSNYIDYPIPTWRGPITLVAAISNGVALNAWAYVKVFGAYQWIISMVMLILMVVGLSVICALGDDESGKEFGVKRGSTKNYQLNSTSAALSMVFLYVIQMGSHPNSKKFAQRLFTLTMSFATLLLYTFFTTDITAQMTSGPPDLPIRNFEDVLTYEYKVIAFSPYPESILRSSKTGSAKLEVYENHFEMKKDKEEAITTIINDKDLKTLIYSPVSTLVPTNSKQKELTDQTFDLKMDDSLFGISTLALQKHSEFLQIFNYYILKAIEGGLLKRLYRKHRMSLFTKESFEMPEPQPLGWNNVMLSFMCLGFGICLSIIMVTMEFFKKKLSKEQRPGTAISRGERAIHVMVAGEMEDDIDIERMFNSLQSGGLERMEEMQARIHLWLEMQQVMQEADKTNANDIEILE